jgi:signal transduction histidine kinase/ligand-binding sensor domain-containing protein/DNA-binding response OmpR family regulator
MVFDIFQDSYGYLWFGTKDGLNCYKGNEILNYYNQPGKKHTINNSYIFDIYEDSNKNLWITSGDFGLDLYDREKDRFISHREILIEKGMPSQVVIRTILEDKPGVLWLASSSGLLKYDYINKTIDRIPYSKNNYNEKSLPDPVIYDLVPYNEDLLVIASFSGVSILNKKTNTFIHHTENNADIHGLTDFRVLDIEISPISNDIYIGTFHDGLFKWNKENNRFDKLFNGGIRDLIIDGQKIWISSNKGLYIYNIYGKELKQIKKNEKHPNSSINSENTQSLFVDKTGTVWIGTFHNGANYYHPSMNKFKHFTSSKCRNSLNNSIIRSIAEDGDGHLLIGTDRGGGLNIYDRNNDYFYHFNKTNLPTLKGDVIKDLHYHDGLIYLASPNGINIFQKTKTGNDIKLIDKTLHTLQKYTIPKHTLDALLSNPLTYIYIDKENTLWVSSDMHIYKINKEETKRYDLTELAYNPLYSIIENNNGNLLFGCNSGLYEYSKDSKKFMNHTKTFFTKTSSLKVKALYKTHSGNYLVGTFGFGLFVLNKNFELLKSVTTNDGMPSNVVNSILSDSLSNYWLSTNNGLVQLNQNYEIKNIYSEADGLQSNQFIANAHCKTKNNELIFGGVNGFNIFDPEKIIFNQYKPPIEISSLKINNKEINFRTSDLLEKNINYTDKIILPYSKNVISFRFNALNYLTPEENEYAYTLEGFDEQWNYIGKDQTASYTNLDPGDYVFRVKASNNDGYWNEKGKSLHISITPPWWKTTWFKVLFIAFLLGIIYLFKKWITYNINIKNKLKYELVEREKAEELEMIKSRFFTNVSHEFRTPLTLIISPVQRLLKGEKMSQSFRNQLILVEKNAQRLLRLVNQLMDFRKLESGKLKLDATWGEIVSFTKDIVDSFTNYAEEKKIQLDFYGEKNGIVTFFDPDKYDKIIYNLLSNAFKYTPEGGSIYVSVSLVMGSDYIDLLTDNDQNREYIQIIVNDTGKGIPENKLNKIFERFYQVDSIDNKKYGTGLGLALTKDLVELHDGKIFVYSVEKNEINSSGGTKFIVLIPKKDNISEISKNKNPLDVKQKDNDYYLEQIETTQTQKAQNASKDTILIIDDNNDFRFYLRNELKKEYLIQEAHDGLEGKSKAENILPDLIICDITMPGIDGTELTKTLKKQETTAHIPIIIITAKTSEESILSGLDIGADEYFTKPFNIEILKKKIKNILDIRNQLKERFSKEVVLQPNNIKIKSLDEQFLLKAMRIVEKNISNEDFNVEKFSKEIGISRMQLYRKLESLTGQAVKEFIKSIRLKRAAQLLIQKELNVSEIAYSVGFKDVSYFRKCFKATYNVSPTEYVNNYYSGNANN